MRLIQDNEDHLFMQTHSLDEQHLDLHAASHLVKTTMTLNSEAGIETAFETRGAHEAARSAKLDLAPPSHVIRAT